VTYINVFLFLHIKLTQLYYTLVYACLIFSNFPTNKNRHSSIYRGY